MCVVGTQRCIASYARYGLPYGTQLVPPRYCNPRAPEELSRVNSLRHRSLRPGSTVLVWAERSETEVRARACTTHGRGTPARLGTMRRKCVPAPACVFPTLPPP